MFFNQIVGADSAEAVIVDVNTLPASPKNVIYRTPGGVNKSVAYEDEKTLNDYISELSSKGFGEYTEVNGVYNFTNITNIIYYYNASQEKWVIIDQLKDITYYDYGDSHMLSMTIYVKIGTFYTNFTVYLSSTYPTFNFKVGPFYNYYAGDEETGSYTKIIDFDYFSIYNKTAVCDCVCNSSGSDYIKVARCDNYILRSGNRFTILFTNANTSASALTLNVNDTGAKAIYINGEASSATNYTLPAGTYSVLYDGTNYQINTDNTIPGVGSGDFDRYKEVIAYLDDEETTTAVNDYTVDAVCTTAGNIADKIAFCDGYVLTSGNRFSLLIANENTYQGELTLNVNGTGAKPIYLNGKPSSGDEYFAYYLPAGTYEVVYGSTATAPYTDVYHINTSGEVPTYTGSYKENAEKVTYLDSTFASRFYQKGDYIDTGVLYKATENINTGYSISAKSTSKNVLGENITLGREITELSNRLDHVVNYEQTQIASKSYSVGDYVYIDTYVNSSDNSISIYNGFRKITTAISSGADITNNSSSVSTLGDEISKLNSDLAVQMISDLSTIKTANVSSCGGTLIKCNGIVTLNFYAIYTSEMVATTDIFTLPAEYRPSSTVYGNGSIFGSNGSFAGYVKVSSAGIVDCDTSTTGTTVQGTLIYKV